MKNIIPFLFSSLIIITVAIWSCTTNTEVNNPTNIKVDAGLEQDTEQNTEEDTDSDFTQEEVNKMAEEIVELWSMWYDDQGMSPKHRRRQKFPEYAQYVAEAVNFYQNNETELGGMLPKDNKAHLIIATMVALESSIRPNCVGTSHNEVGLLQIHGKAAFAGHSPKEIRKNPRLGVFLGVRWLAFHSQFCAPIHGEFDWTGTLSLYGAGLNGGRKINGQCKKIKMAKKRINLTNYYETRIL